jgi:hypothetical protein
MENNKSFNQFEIVTTNKTFLFPVCNKRLFHREGDAANYCVIKE